MIPNPETLLFSEKIFTRKLSQTGNVSPILSENTMYDKKNSISIYEGAVTKNREIPKKIIAIDDKM